MFGHDVAQVRLFDNGDRERSYVAVFDQGPSGEYRLSALLDSPAYWEDNLITPARRCRRPPPRLRRPSRRRPSIRQLRPTRASRRQYRRKIRPRHGDRHADEHRYATPTADRYAHADGHACTDADRYAHADGYADSYPTATDTPTPTETFTPTATPTDTPTPTPTDPPYPVRIPEEQALAGDGLPLPPICAAGGYRLGDDRALSYGMNVDLTALRKTGCGCCCVSEPNDERHQLTGWIAIELLQLAGDTAFLPLSPTVRR